MRHPERIARDLAERLVAIGVPAHARGADRASHWDVDVGPVGPRALVVTCFWYERRSPLHPYEGPEYLVHTREADARVADGRTRQVAEAIACARAWLAGADRERLAAEVPFLDRYGRAVRGLAARLDPRLRHDLGDVLWVYGDGRSCKVEPQHDGTFSCAFLLGQALVAEGADDIPNAVALWLIDGVPLRTLAARVAGARLGPHAEVLETDPARWHWLRFRDRIANERDVLAPLRPLIEALAASPVATKFYTYSSMNRLWFSASSHHPCVTDGLPVVCPVQGACVVGTFHAQSGVDWPAAIRCDFRRATTLIEEILAAAPVQPFFGSRPHYHLPLLAACFARQGSALRPRLVQRHGGYDLIVSDAAGARSCRIGERDASFDDATGHLSATWSTIDDTVRAVRRYLEEGATLDALAADSGDSGATDVYRAR